jgi:hypothetical protein
MGELATGAVNAWRGLVEAVIVLVLALSRAN